MEDSPPAKSPFSPSETHMIEKTLPYGKAALRVLVSPDGAWFAAKDLYEVHGRRTDRADLAHFAPEHLKLATFQSDEGPVLLTAVSSLGVATIASRLPFPQNRILDAWIRKTARRLAEEHGCPPLEMVQLADGLPPVKPHQYSDHSDAWYKLALQGPQVEPRSANLHEPALFDEDPELPPHDPSADLPKFAAIRASQERRRQTEEVLGDRARHLFASSYPRRAR